MYFADRRRKSTQDSVAKQCCSTVLPKQYCQNSVLAAKQRPEAAGEARTAVIPRSGAHTGGG
jgi:hypothetical protein